MSDPHHQQQSGNGAPRDASPQSEPEPGSGSADRREPTDQHERAHGRDQQCLEFCPICRAADVLRASAPPELREQWQTVQREALLTTRALIEHYLARLDEEPAEPPARVEDIPIL